MALLVHEGSHLVKDSLENRHRLDHNGRVDAYRPRSHHEHLQAGVPIHGMMAAYARARSHTLPCLGREGTSF